MRPLARFRGPPRLALPPWTAEPRVENPSNRTFRLENGLYRGRLPASSLPGTNAGADWLDKVTIAFDQLQSAYQIYKSAEFRAVVQHRQSEERWTNILGKIQFSDQEPPTGPPKLDFLVEPNVYTLTNWLTPQAAFDLLKDFSTGVHRLTIESRQLSISVIDSPDQSPTNYPPENHPTGRYDNRYGVDYSVAIFPFGTRDQLNRVGVHQDNLAPLGVNALTQLLHHHVVEPEGPIPTNTYTKPETGLVVVLPLFHARLANVSIEGKIVTAAVELAKGVPPEDFSLVIRAGHYGGHDGFGDHGERPVIHRPLRSTTVRQEFPATLRDAYVELFWEKTKLTFLKKVDSVTASRVKKSVNTQLRLYESFDPQFKWLAQKLGGGKQGDDQIDFEWAVAHLLSLAGFHIHWLGYLRGAMREREIDVVAWEPENKWLILGECTVKGSDVDRKLVDLADKAASFSTDFDDWTIKKLLFTTISAAALKGKQTSAANEKGIILVPSEALDALRSLVEAGHPREGIWYGLRTDLVSHPSFIKQ